MTNSTRNTSQMAASLAERILQGAQELTSFAEKLSKAEWMTPVKGDGRSIGVVVHHVASTYPMEIELAQVLAAGDPITGATMEVVNKMNAEHAKENSGVSKEETLELLKQNSGNAANAVRCFSDEDLQSAAKVSLNANAPLTAQFFIEDHALRHSYHHLAKIRETLA